MPKTLQDRYIVAFQGKRDSYQVPAALAEENALECLITDLYCPDMFAAIARTLPMSVGKKIAGRWSPLVSSRLVKAKVPRAYWSAGFDKIMGFDRRHERHQQIQWELGFRAGVLARQRKASGLIYSYQWLGFLDGIGDGNAVGRRKILFQVHPLPSQICRILSVDRSKSGIFSGLDIEEAMTDAKIEAYERAVMAADGVIVSSSFTKKGLLDIGYPAERVGVIPYGTTMSHSWAAETDPEASKASIIPYIHSATPLRLLWVGQVTYRKGLHHLLSALRAMPTGMVTLTIVGRTVEDQTLLSGLPEGVTVVGEVSETELDKLYSSHDLFAMPSLIEGFGLVYLEAMIRGLPVICTHNSGCPDIVTSGYDGIIVEPGSMAQLVTTLRDAYHDRQRISEMRVHAQASASRWTWERFREHVRGFVWDIEKQKPSVEYRSSSERKSTKDLTMDGENSESGACA